MLLQNIINNTIFSRQKKVSSNYFYLIIIICLHTVLWFQVIDLQLCDIKYSYEILIIYF